MSDFAASASIAPSPVVAAPAEPAARATAGDRHTTFHDVLSALNPLQYLPVIGTIYRAVTGDQIPESVRRIGSAIGSFLMGGPVGLGINLAMLAAEKASGIDLDAIGQGLVGGHGTDAPATGGEAVASADTPASAARPWSAAQLLAYGVGTRADGTLEQGELRGADVLNTLELSRIQTVQMAYGRTMGLAG